MPLDTNGPKKPADQIKVNPSKLSPLPTTSGFGRLQRVGAVKSKAQAKKRGKKR